MLQQEALEEPSLLGNDPERTWWSIEGIHGLCLDLAWSPDRRRGGVRPVDWRLITRRYNYFVQGFTIFAEVCTYVHTSIATCSISKKINAKNRCAYVTGVKRPHNLSDIPLFVAIFVPAKSSNYFCNNYSPWEAISKCIYKQNSWRLQVRSNPYQTNLPLFVYRFHDNDDG